MGVCNIFLVSIWLSRIRILTKITITLVSHASKYQYLFVVSLYPNFLCMSNCQKISTCVLGLKDSTFLSDRLLINER
jgi:hypothetical protein